MIDDMDVGFVVYARESMQKPFHSLNISDINWNDSL